MHQVPGAAESCVLVVEQCCGGGAGDRPGERQSSHEPCEGRPDDESRAGLLTDHGVGSIPYSPLAKGRLARPWGGNTARSANDPVAERSFSDADKPIADAVQEIAEERGIPMAHVALAWVLNNPV
nr:aldo/keto reductase [Arthrobacter sp. OY3WO11]